MRRRRPGRGRAVRGLLLSRGPGRAVAAGLLALLALLPGPPAAGQGKLEDLLKGIPLPGATGGAGLSDARIAAGLKEALQVGTDQAVRLTGRLDGYFASAAIKILMPERLRSVETGLRAVGLGHQVDELVLGMNRAAERAVPRARATDRLTRAFRPVVVRAMDEVGVARQYKDVMTRAEAIPFLNVERYDLDGYVVDQALAGLFHVVVEEEQRIRRDPAARVTDLLREVFGGR